MKTTHFVRITICICVGSAIAASLFLLSRPPNEIQVLHKSIESNDTTSVARIIANNPSLLHAKRPTIKYGQTRNGTALHTAADTGQTECLRLLLKLGADPNATDYFGRTPLHLACQQNSLAAVSDLLEAGADPNILSNSKDSPIVSAIARGQSETVRLLLSHGANIQTLDFRVVKQAVASNNSDVIQAFRMHIMSLPESELKNNAVLLLP